jgi:hypothetical protein
VRSWGVTRFRGMISTQPGSTSLASFKVLTLDSTDITLDCDASDAGLQSLPCVLYARDARFSFCRSVRRPGRRTSVRAEDCARHQPGLRPPRVQWRSVRFRMSFRRPSPLTNHSKVGGVLRPLPSKKYVILGNNLNFLNSRSKIQ